MKGFTMYRGNIGTRKRVCKRIAAFVLAFFISFSVVAGSEIEAEAMGIGAGAAVFSVVAYSLGAYLGAEITIDAAGATVLAIAAVLSKAWEFDVYISDQAAAAGMKKTDYIKAKIEAFIDSTGRTLEDGYRWLLDGVTCTKEGVFQLAASAAEKWKEFIDYLTASEDATVYSDISSVPIDASYINGLKIYSIDFEKYYYFYDDNSRYGNRRWLDFSKYNGYEGEAYYFLAEYIDSGRYCHDFVIWVPYESSFINTTAIKFEANVLEKESIFTFLISGVFAGDIREYAYNYDNIQNDTSRYLSAAGEELVVFENRGELVSFCDKFKSLTQDDIDFIEGCNEALIGSVEELHDKDTYVHAGELDVDQALVLDPSLLDDLSDVNDLPSDVVEFPLDEYAKAIADAFDGLHVSDLPTVGEVELPVTDDLPTIGVGTLDETAVPAIPNDNTATDDPAQEIAVTDVPGITDVMVPVIDWGLGYLSPVKGILSKFPFSIPYDLYMIIAALAGDDLSDPINADPKNLSIQNDLAPPSAKYEKDRGSPLHWNMTFVIPWGENKTEIPLDIDLSDFGWIFRIIRYFTGILWLVGLLSWTRKESN